MKITITESVSKEIELPKFFKENDRYYMAVSDTHLVRVTDKPFDSFYQPGIVQDSIECFSIKEFQHISEAEFRAAFLRVSVTIDKLLNYNLNEQDK